MIKRNISCEILKTVEKNDENDIINNVSNDFEVDINTFYGNTNLHNQKEESFSLNQNNNEDDVESLAPNTEDNVDSDIDIAELDYHLEKQQNIPDNIYSKINNNSNNRYLDYIRALDSCDKNKIENQNKNIDKNKESNSRINELEMENQILKIEVRELKEKMQMFEIFMLNFQTSSSSINFGNGDFNNYSNMDKLKTMIKDNQFEIKKIKEQLEYIEALENENRDKIEVIETLMENIKE